MPWREGLEMMRGGRAAAAVDDRDRRGGILPQAEHRLHRARAGGWLYQPIALPTNRIPEPWHG
jgi:hypothetical protein